jgi:outer membrane receptor for ferric coprogen and ferric-rhodotorulic acid
MFREVDAVVMRRWRLTVCAGARLARVVHVELDWSILAEQPQHLRGPAYAVVDASLGYRFQQFTVSVLGSNLGNRRDGAQLSELGEGQFYRLPARRIDATLTWHYKQGRGRPTS